jgi:uncharacterized protein (TIGR02217 family)
VPSAIDQVIGTGDGTTATFHLRKAYGSEYAPWTREITKPVEGSVVVAVDGVLQPEGTAIAVDTTTGVVTFKPNHIPPAGARITAGFAFDVPVRFETDKLEVNLQGFQHGAIPNIPVIEIRL